MQAEMQVKRFVAADMRRALELVRAELGPEAIILSNRRTQRGVEIVTTLEQPVGGEIPLSGRNYAEGFSDSDRPLASDNAWRDQVGVDAALGDFAAPGQRPRELSPDGGVGPASGKTRVQLAQEMDRARERMLSARSANTHATERPPTDSLPATGTDRVRPAGDDQVLPAAAATAPPAAAANRDSEELQALKSEINGMRRLLEEQLGHLARGQMAQESPVYGSLWQRFARLGLADQQIEELLGDMAPGSDLTRAWREALARLAHRLPVAGEDIVAKGGVFAFVGPTGAGKTTTIGKLAARFVLEHGPDQVALVTTDTFRIAAHDQLRSFGRILNVPVRVVADGASLPAVLNSLRHCALVLIDTAGFRLGDPALKQQLAALHRQQQVQKLMVLSCNSQLQMMKAALHAYDTVGLSGCVLTKTDETASLGEALSVVMARDLPVAYTTNGQHIPEDIALGKAHTLITRAVALLKNSARPEPATTASANPSARGKAATPGLV